MKINRRRFGSREPMVGFLGEDPDPFDPDIDIVRSLRTTFSYISYPNGLDYKHPQIN
jgi:hypothetical protein